VHVQGIGQFEVDRPTGLVQRGRPVLDVRDVTVADTVELQPESTDRID
jgi:hypothetical protein